jgi:hypothetical protein
MANQTPDVRVRLSAEGLQDVVKAFETMQAKAEAAGKGAHAAGEGTAFLTEQLGGLAEILPELTIAAAIVGFIEMGKSVLETAVNIGHLEQKTGISTETLSTFNFAAQQTGIDQESMNKGLVKAVRFFDEYDKGASKARDAVRGLFGDEGALKGLNEDERIIKVTDAIARLEPGAKRTGAAIAVFGKAGAELIPMLDNLGTGGIDEVRKKAEKLGLVFDQDLVDAAERAHAAMKDLSALGQGAVTQFMAGLAPELANAAEEISNQVSFGGVNGFREVGKYAGYIINGIVAAFIVVGKTVAFVLEEGKLLWDDFGNTAKDDIKGIWTTLKAGAGYALNGDAGQFLSQKDVDRLTKPGENRFLSRLNEFGKQVQDSVGALFKEPRKTEHKKGKGDHSEDDAENERALKTAEKLSESRRKLTEARLDAEIAVLKASNKLAEDEEKHRYDQGLVAIDEYFKDRADRLNAQYDKERDLIKGKIAAQQKEIDFTKTRKLGKDETPGQREAQANTQQAELEKLNGDLRVNEVNRNDAIANNNAEQIDATRQLSRARLEAEAQIFTAEGRRFDAEQKRLEAEVAGLQRLKGESADAFAARQKTLQDTGTQKINFDRITQDGKTALDSLGTARQQIEDQVKTGQLDQLNAEDLIRQKEQERLPQLQQIAEAMKAAAVTDEQKQAAAQFAEQINGIAIASNKAAQYHAEFVGALEQGIHSGALNFLTELGDGAHSVGDAFRAMAAGIISSLQQWAAQMLANLITIKLMKALLGSAGGGGGFLSFLGIGGAGHAEGGEISGPGTGTSDSIPAWLSNGEYVVKAAVVKQPGMLGLLNHFNYGGGNVRRRSSFAFADGGIVGAMTGVPGVQSGGGSASLSATLDVSPELLIKRLEASPEWGRVHVRTTEANAKKVNSALGK